MPTQASTSDGRHVDCDRLPLHTVKPSITSIQLWLNLHVRLQRRAKRAERLPRVLCRAG